MKKILSVLFAGALLAPAALFAASFEGKVALKMTSPGGQTMEIRQSIKGDKIRIEMPGQEGMGVSGSIMDTTKNEMTVVMDAQRTYMVMSMGQVPGTPMAEKAEDVPTLEKTGEKEKILGYDAEKYIATTQDTKTDLWLAEGIGAFTGFGNRNPMGGRGGRGGRGAAAQAWERALAGKDLFPLRAVGRDKDGKETFRMEVTSIEKQSLPDSLFQPPAGFQKLDMGGGMRGMMPGGFPGGMRPGGG